MNGKRKKAYTKLAKQLNWTEKQLKFHIRKNCLEAAHNHKPLKGQGPKKVKNKKALVGTPCFGKGNWLCRQNDHPVRYAIFAVTEELKGGNPPIKAFARAQEMYDLKAVADRLSKPELLGRIKAILDS